MGEVGFDFSRLIVRNPPVPTLSNSMKKQGYILDTIVKSFDDEDEADFVDSLVDEGVISPQELIDL